MTTRLCDRAHVCEHSASCDYGLSGTEAHRLVQYWASRRSEAGSGTSTTAM